MAFGRGRIWITFKWPIMTNQRGSCPIAIVWKLSNCWLAPKRAPFSYVRAALVTTPCPSRTMGYLITVSSTRQIGAMALLSPTMSTAHWKLWCCIMLTIHSRSTMTPSWPHSSTLSTDKMSLCQQRQQLKRINDKLVESVSDFCICSPFTPFFLL